MTTGFDQSDVRNALRLEDDIRISDAAALKELLVEALGARRNFTVNLESVTAMDVTAVQLLVAAEQDAKTAECEFRLEGNLPENLVNLMAAMGLQRFPGQRSAA